MKKITTLFKKDPNDLGRVINEVNPENAWALTEGRGTIKHDGTACMVKDGFLYKRYDSKVNKKTGKRNMPPEGAIPCQPEPDKGPAGHWPHWVKVSSDNPNDKYHLEGLRNFFKYYRPCDLIDGTYELCGPSIQNNREEFPEHMLIEHGSYGIIILKEDRTFEGLKRILEKQNIEGIVFHHNDGSMCKIRKSDYGFKR